MCKTELSFKSITNNLKKHVTRKHPFVKTDFNERAKSQTPAVHSKHEEQSSYSRPSIAPETELTPSTSLDPNQVEGLAATRPEHS